MRVLLGFSIAIGLLTSCNTGHTPTRVFVSFPASQAIEKIDIPEQKVLRRTTVGMLPHNMLLNPETGRLYVVVVGSQAIAEIDSDTGDLLRTFPTEATPLARDDGSTIQDHIDQNAASHTTCFDCHHGGEGGVAPAVVGARPFGIAASADGNTLYVSNGRSASLAVIDIASGNLTQTVHLAPVGTAHEPTALLRVGNFLYVTLRPTLPSLDNAVVRQINLEDWTVVGETVTGANAGVLAANATADEILVSNSESNTVTRLTPAAEYVGRHVVGEGPLGLLSTPDGAQLVIANYYNNSLSVVELNSQETSNYKLEYDGKAYSNPTQLALDDNGSSIYVVSGGTNGYLLTFDLIARHFTHVMPIGGLPFGITTITSN